MRVRLNRFVLTMLAVSCLFRAFEGTVSAGTISGTVNGPDGGALRGAFVRARNPQTRITLSVLSDNQGRYRLRDLAAATYEIRATAIGYGDDIRSAIQSGRDAASIDFKLKPGKVRWSDLNSYQGKVLLP